MAKTESKKAATPVATKTPVAEDKNHVTPKQAEVLQFLSKRKTGASKKELWEKFKAGSAVLGAGTKEEDSGPETLLGKGFITAEKHEGERGVFYKITSRGNQAAAKAGK